MKQTTILLALLLCALHLPAQTNTNTLTFTVNGVKFNMKKVEGGTFNMGATPEQQNPDDDEKPTHQVTLSSYYIGETEVTQALWQAVMGISVRDQRNKANTSWPIRGEGENYPIYYVSLKDCQDFIRKLNSLTGRTFRLPTEAEWEYAARGGRKSNHTQYSGSKNIYEVAWYNGNSGNTTHYVKSRKHNELGIYDMSGNVCEWCQDWYGSYSSNAQINPTGPSSGKFPVIRGGSWIDSDSSCRSAGRSNISPDDGNSCLGLRLALSDNTAASVATQKPAQQQPAASKPSNSKNTLTFTVKGITFNMKKVEGGTFMMGATSEMEHASDIEKPAHKVTLSTYYIGETEVTQALWQAVMEENPSEFKGRNLPVENVSWSDCQLFIEELNSLTGKKFRLPTEAEWEYAARGGNMSRRTQYSGSNNIDEVAWYYKNSGDRYLSGKINWLEISEVCRKNNCRTHPVKTKKPNELGIYDMSGNVCEWCQDNYSLYSSNAQTNPIATTNGIEHMYRGGCYNYPQQRLSYRSHQWYDYYYNILGLRLSLTE